MEDTDYVEVFRDDADEYRWRRKAANHQVVSVSGEGYTRSSDALEAARRENPGIEPTVVAS